MGVMPYQFEKGLFPTLLEEYFNEGLDGLAGKASLKDALALPGPAARLRAIWRFGSVARFLRERPPNSGLEATERNSFIRSRMFPATPPTDPGTDFQRIVAVNWLGMTVVGDGKDRRFFRADPQKWQPGATTGHWNGYYGNVELIVCETVQRMLEVSLGLDHVVPPLIDITAEDAARLEDELRREARRVWPIYMFLTCPKPWFEGWITWQRHSTVDPALRGQVTVILATPGHGRPVSPSPVDLVHDTATKNGRMNAYYLHGLEDAQGGYDGRYLELAKAAGATQVMERGADPVSSGGPQGMWVVSHPNHDSAIVWSNFAEIPGREPQWNPGQGKPEAWDLPPIAAYRPATLKERGDVGGKPPMAAISGYDEVVVVQPAGRDGGVVAGGGGQP